MPTDLEVIQGARQVLSDPERWAQGANAFDADGRKLEDGSQKEAVQYCLVGAIQKAGCVEFDEDIDHVLTRCMKDSNGMPWGGMAFEWNDRPQTAHADVLAVLDCAIACLSSASPKERHDA